MINIENIEKSACGVGFVVSRNGSYSNEILQKTLLALRCQEHRGGCSADMITADGSGIMTDIPFEMLGYEKGDIAVASLFLPVDPERRRISVHHFEEIFDFMGMKVLEYRDVPIDKSVLGKQALELLPPMVHAIIKRPSHCRTDYSFDKLLYQANMFNRMRQKEIFPGRPREFFFNSLSANTIVYKGLTRASDLERFYLDLQNPNFKTRFGMFHRRFSTNTVSTWDKVQPFRLVGHNGEINTIEGNRSNAFSREKSLGLRKEELLTREGISDSGSLNEMVEAMAYRSSMHDMEDVLAIMMPPAKLDKAYYKFWSRVMEPWDGPAMITYSNGRKLGARLDRNGFRPCRWAMTDDFFYLSSEAGSFHLDESVIKQKGTLNAGTGVVADLVTGDINFNDPSESKLNVEAIFDPRLVPLVHLEPKQTHAEHLDKKYLFSYTEEDISRILIPMMSTGKEPIGSMGDTARLAIFSDEPRSFFDYFFQNFAQVTNPPLDYIREKNVTDLVTYLGKKPNIFAKKELLPPTKAFELESPILNLGQMEFVRSLENPEVSDFQVISHELDMTFNREHGSVGFQNVLDLLATQAVQAVNNKKASVLIISDRNASPDRLPIPSLLALRSVVQGLTEAGVRLEASVVVDSAEIKTTHHVACLIGFGATAVCPYLALEIGRFEEGHKISKLELDPDVKEKNLIHCYEIGLLKIMSKMGISVARSYQSAKLFSVIGLGKKIMENYFPKVPSYIGGLEIKEIVANVIKFAAQSQKFEQEEMLVNNFLFREDTVGTSGEKHSMTLSRSKMIHKLVRDTGVGLNNMALYNEYLKAGIDNTPVNVRHLFKLRKRNAIPISEVESIESIMTRFGSGAMSFGAISAESQRDIILAMREIGG
ncbi:MAG: glutamate synthase large subunit, partial [Bacteroidetes bacterium]